MGGVGHLYKVVVQRYSGGRRGDRGGRHSRICVRSVDGQARMAAAVWRAKRSRGSGSMHDSSGSWLCNGLGRLVWTLRDATATLLEPQPLGDKETGWQVLDNGRSKLARRALHCPLKTRRSCRRQRASFPTGDSRKASTVGLKAPEDHQILAEDVSRPPWKNRPRGANSGLLVIVYVLCSSWSEWRVKVRSIHNDCVANLCWSKNVRLPNHSNPYARRHS